MPKRVAARSIQVRETPTRLPDGSAAFDVENDRIFSVDQIGGGIGDARPCGRRSIAPPDPKVKLTSALPRPPYRTQHRPALPDTRKQHVLQRSMNGHEQVIIK